MTAHEVTQRVIVRMLFDPSFREEVYRDPNGVLGPLGVPPALQAQLVAHDPRAFAVDPWRGHRAVTAVLREAVVTALALTRLGISAQEHMDFIASAHFHRCVMERGLLVTAFFEYLDARLDHAATRASSRRERAAVAAGRACLALERAIAEARRVRPSPGSDGSTRVVAGPVRAIALPEGTSAAWGRAFRALGPDPLAALVTPGPATKAALAGLFGQELGNSTEWVLVALEEGAPALSFTGPALAGLLQRAVTPVERAVLVALAEDEGATAEEANEIIDELVADGLLVRA